MTGSNTNSTADEGRTVGRSTAILIATDDRYLDALPAFATSLSHHNPGIDLPIICLVPQETSGCARQVVRTTFASVSLEAQLVPVAPPVENPPTCKYVTPTSNLRLLIPDLLPGLARALYLDVDTLVLGELAPLIHVDLAGKAVGAVRDPFNPCLGSPLALKGPPLPKDRAIRPYCNTGVMVLDLDQWRMREIGPAAMDLIRNHDARLNLIDQDALNLVLDGDFLQLPQEWNVYPLDFDSSNERPARILHFIGMPKPWMPTYPPTASWRRYQEYKGRRCQRRRSD